MAAKNKTSRTRHGSPILDRSILGDASRQERRRSAREDAKTLRGSGRTQRHQPRHESRKLTRRDALGIFALGLLVVGSYFPAFFAGFVWDDEIITEAVVRDWSGLWHIWFSPAEIKREGHYWPLVYTTFWLEHKLWGYAPTGYHVVNVLLHLGNTLLLWRLAGRLTVPVAWLLAAVFAVHPLHVESVAWVIERKDLLSTLFYLAAFSTWVHFVEEPRPAFGWRRYLLALALFVLGLLCKSIVVTLPAALLIWALVATWPRDRRGSAQSGAVLRGGADRRGGGHNILLFQGNRFLGLLNHRAGAHCGARAMVLRGQAAVARGPGRHLSALGREGGGPAGLGLRGGHGGLGRGALVPSASDRSRAAGRGLVLRGDADAGTRLCGLRLHAVFLCCGPVSVLSRHRGDGGARERRGAWGGEAAGDVAEGARRAWLRSS